MRANVGRRGVLAGLCGMGALTMAPPIEAAKRAPFFKRVGLPIGLQLYTLGDEPEKDLDGVLTKVASIGYRDLQLPSLFGKDAATIKAAADKAGVAFSCIHLSALPIVPPSVLSLNSPIQKIVDDLGVLGIRNAILPLMAFPADFKLQPGEAFLPAILRVAAGADVWKQTANLLNEKAAALKPHGISLGYHNHNVEFAKVGSGTGWDILVKETDPGLVGFEVDIGWVAAAGLDPVAFLRSVKGRVRFLHVKDVLPSTQANTALKMDPTEIGSGKQDWARILPAAYKAGVRHFYVEQEPPFAMPRMDAVAKSYAWLAALKA